MDEFVETSFLYDTDISREHSYWKNYFFIKEIGSGGMGVVYKAKQKSPERFVAIKIMQYNSGASARRFEREMQIASELDHPGIAKTYDAGILKGHKYLVMEYIDGLPLDEYLQKNKLSLREKLQLIPPICDALSYAHSKGIIHRDLKPSNILISKNGIPIIIDFGVAKRMDSREFDLTKTGEVVGTPNYMSPEQISGKRTAIDHRSDIYSLGAIFYELVCGERMYSGDNPLEVMFKIQYDAPVALLKLNPQLDKNLNILWQQATHKNKEYRYQSVSLLAADIDKCIAGKKIHRRYQTKNFVYIAAAICCCFFVVMLVLFHRTSGKIELSEKQEREARQFERLLHFVENNQEDEAKKIRDTLSSLRPQQSIQLAKAYFRVQDYQRARQLLTPLKYEPEATYYLALILYKKELYSEAQQALEELTVNNYNATKINYYLGLCHYKQQNTKEALSFLLAAKNIEEIDLLEAIADIYIKNQNNKEAIPYLKKCIQIAPFEAKYFLMLAQIYFAKGDYYRCLFYANKSLSIRADHSSHFICKNLKLQLNILSQIYNIRKKYGFLLICFVDEV